MNMSTEEKKAAKTAEALSQAEMAGVAGGKSHSGKSGGGHKLVDQADGAETILLSEAEMSGVAGGTSRSGKSGGGHKLVDNEATAEINKLL